MPHDRPLRLPGIQRRKENQAKKAKRQMGHTRRNGARCKGLKSFEEYKDWLADHCTDWQLVQTIYNEL